LGKRAKPAKRLFTKKEKSKKTLANKPIANAFSDANSAVASSIDTSRTNLKTEELLIVSSAEPKKPEMKAEEDIKKINAEAQNEIKQELRILKDVSPNEYFILATGAPLKNIKELVDALDYMDQGVFEYHVNSEKNDFAEWIRWSLNEQELADTIRELSTIKETQNTIMKHLVRKYL